MSVDKAVHELKVLTSMIRSRPGAVLEGDPWPIRGEWLASELGKVVDMLQDEQDGPVRPPDALLPR